MNVHLANRRLIIQFRPKCYRVIKRVCTTDTNQEIAPLCQIQSWCGYQKPPPPPVPGGIGLMETLCTLGKQHFGRLSLTISTLCASVM